MSPGELRFPIAYYNNIAYFFAPSDQFCWTYFGGPSDVNLQGLRHGPAPLHHIFTLHPTELSEAIRYSPVPPLPLFYGLRYDGCTLTYRMPEVARGSGFVCKILRLAPVRSSDDFPYISYPALLPYIPMRLMKRKRCSLQRFAKFTHQGLDVDQSSLVVIVPPIFVGGVSIWGPDGDAEEVQMIFECDFENEIVTASNQCT